MSGRSTKGAYRPPASAATRWKPTAELKRTTVRSMRNLARNLKDDHPDMGTHIHVQDAASALERDNSQAAIRHLTAAIGNVTPQSLHRHGITTDQEHAQAKANMDAVHRHLLLVKELQDHEEHNSNLAAISRQATEDAQGAQDDKPTPNQTEGYGPGRLSAVPTARTPQGGNQAMNAPRRLPTGGTDPATAKPIEITTKTTHQIAASWDDIDRQIEAIELGIHFNPFEKRGKGGEWSGGGDASPVAKYSPAADAKVSSASALMQKALAAASPDDPRTAATRPIADRMHAALARKDYDGAAQAAKELAYQLRGHPYPVWGPAHDGAAQMYDAAQMKLSQAKSTIAAGWLAHERSILDFSAETGRLSTEPSPLGKPGGPGLWHVKNMQLPPYIQHIAKALMAKRGMSESQAIATARAATKRWIGGKNTRPEVRAASGLSDAQWRAKQATAHAHSNTYGLAGDAFLHEQRGKGGRWVMADGGLRGFPGDMDDKQLAEARKEAVARRRADGKPNRAESDVKTEQQVRSYGRKVLAVKRPMYYSPADNEAQMSNPSSWEQAAMAIELAAGHPPYRYKHGWIKLDGGGMPLADKEDVAAHREDARTTASRSMLAAAGSHQHAEELRGLAAQAELRQGQNYRTLRSSAEGSQSNVATSQAAGTDLPNTTQSDAARALRRAATMIDRNQPSLARVHSSAIREAAKREGYNDPAFRSRLNAAANKLETLPRSQGALAERAPGLDEAQRTAAAQRYAASLRDSSSLSWSDHERAIELATLSLAIPANGSGGGGRTTTSSASSGSGNSRSQAASNEARNPLGQFTSGGGGGAQGKGKPGAKPGAKGGPAAKGKAPAGYKPDAHVKHQQHVLMQTAANDRAKARALIQQRNALMAAQASAGGKTSSGQAGSKTSGQSGSTTASTAPASTSATSTTAATTSSLKTSSATSSSLNTSASSNAKKAQIAALNTQISGLLTAAAAATAQALALNKAPAKKVA